MLVKTQAAATKFIRVHDFFIFQITFIIYAGACVPTSLKHEYFGRTACEYTSRGKNEDKMNRIKNVQVSDTTKADSSIVAKLKVKMKKN